MKIIETFNNQLVSKFDLLNFLKQFESIYKSFRRSEVLQFRT